MHRTINSQFEEASYTQSTVETSRGALLAVMNVEIRPGQKDKIFIHEFDNQYELAQAFVQKHGLPAKALPILHKQIQSNKLTVRESAAEKQDDLFPTSRRN